jgi:hypothetical protein
MTPRCCWRPSSRPVGRCNRRGTSACWSTTREGHRPDLTDCPPAKLTRGGQTFIGEDGPMGRILVRGEQGHDIVHQLLSDRR